MEHQLLDGAALAERRLEAAVLAAPQAVALLDIASNCLTPKVGSRLAAAAAGKSALMTCDPWQTFVSAPSPLCMLPAYNVRCRYPPCIQVLCRIR